MSLLKNFIRDEQGQDVVEYALLVALMAIGAIVVYTAFGTNIKTSLQASGAKVVAAPAAW